MIGVFANRTNCSAQSSITSPAKPYQVTACTSIGGRLRRLPVRHHRDDRAREADGQLSRLARGWRVPQSRAARHELDGRHFDDERFRAGVVHHLKPLRGIAAERVAEGLACVEGELLKEQGVMVKPGVGSASPCEIGACNSKSTKTTRSQYARFICAPEHSATVTGCPWVPIGAWNRPKVQRPNGTATRLRPGRSPFRSSSTRPCCHTTSQNCEYSPG